MMHGRKIIKLLKYLFIYKTDCTSIVEISNKIEIIIPSMERVLNNGSSDINRPSSSK
jgi:hypothetical protein